MSGVIYDYRCSACLTTFETRHPMDHTDPVPCPCCGSHDTQKVLSAPASVLDWRDSDSVHASKRFRGRVLNTTAGGQ